MMTLRRKEVPIRMFESSFNFEALAEFLGYFADKLVKMVFQTKEWFDKVSKSFE